VCIATDLKKKGGRKRREKIKIKEGKMGDAAYFPFASSQTHTLTGKHTAHPQLQAD
jgi:hypothetical protein